MGGSLALALRENAARGTRHVDGVNGRIIGVSRRPETLEAALAAGAIDAGTTNLTEGVRDADIVVLATPARTILRQLPEVGRYARPGTLVLDLGSTKAEICAALADLPLELQPVGGHPMCGKELAGFAAAEAGLYRNKTFVLCPLSRTSDAALARTRALVEAVGARPVILDPAAHDRAVAAISHLPYAVAAALVNTIAAADDPLARSLAASGYRDTTRLAASDVDMMLDILLTNRSAVLGWLDAYTEQLSSLRESLAAEDEPALRTTLTRAHDHRIQHSTFDIQH